MIVNYTSEGWEIITQRAHGMLSAAIAYNWNDNVKTHRWLETLMAIAEHDDGQTELNGADLLTASGGPVDFKMREITIEHCINTINLALSKSTYIALLCSMHLEFVCGKNCGKRVTAFLKEQQKARVKWRHQLKMTSAEADRDYALLEWCDALSLLLCQRENQPEHRAVDISRGPDKKKYQLIQKDTDTLTVSPWPFQPDQLQVQYEKRLLPALAYNNAAAFKAALLNAPLEFKTWIFEK
ncbi:DUF3891 family protein [Chitinophaga pinensis]|uniref:DUF3891 family protein n=1 Tax=Chitinophaga pinensis (strain ATCC 43595 / DSM 2588 / LMG 13176 / NBRC 15968 / NCIMB 11800 / UQM 2034) TaxID=485918 RepID=A0A979G3M6_CHIPD|nr:DUF3891 family protein [Chitinophaga pinensis]ACU60210.1 hypothetical protein Cpin_2731 [Chitinophaga pinensis DSM 2588]